jgi:hypothetical protein
MTKDRTLWWRLLLISGACLAIVGALIGYHLRLIPAGVDRAAEISYVPRRVPKLELALLEPFSASSGPIARDPFAFGPVKVRTAAPPPPTPTPRSTAGPRPASTPQPEHQGFDHEYIGLFGPTSLRVAVLRHGSEIIVTTPGDTIDGRFVVEKFDEHGLTLGPASAGGGDGLFVPVSEQ